jgi:preprotein translocase subunit SecA
MDIGGNGQAGDGSAAARQAVPIPTRAPSTTIDELEREFQRKKKRELEQARTAGSSDGSNGNAPRVTGEKVGRNDPCPCGSGKKYKKCHGAQA